MCGRYYVDDETAKEIEKIVKNVENKLKIKRGEIFPTNQVPVLTSDNNNTKQAIISTWGFPNFRNKGVIINARSETAFEKPMFRKSLLNRRCLIPASGFFEWNKQKEKYYFTSKDRHTFYFCGIFNTFQDENRCVILTTNPNNSIADIHNRMPLILPPEHYKNWLFDDSATQKLLKETPILLDRTIDHEREKLF